MRAILSTRISSIFRVILLFPLKSTNVSILSEDYSVYEVISTFYSINPARPGYLKGKRTVEVAQSESAKFSADCFCAWQNVKKPAKAKEEEEDGRRLVEMESSLSPYREIIESMLWNVHSDEDISSHLHLECGLTKGFSKANIREFSAQNGIGRERVQDSKLESEIAQAINEVSNSILINLYDC